MFFPSFLVKPLLITLLIVTLSTSLYFYKSHLQSVSFKEGYSLAQSEIQELALKHSTEQLTELNEDLQNALLNNERVNNKVKDLNATLEKVKQEKDIYLEKLEHVSKKNTACERIDDDYVILFKQAFEN